MEITAPLPAMVLALQTLPISLDRVVMLGVRFGFSIFWKLVGKV